jgi:TonB family protein
VVDVQVLMSTGVEPFERSAAEAAWQFRFRPYRPGILTNGVYVVMPFWFH